MPRIVLDPTLLNIVEYDIWRSGDEWVCVAGHLPFVGEVSGHGSTPQLALAECLDSLNATIEEFNRE